MCTFGVEWKYATCYLNLGSLTVGSVFVPKALAVPPCCGTVSWGRQLVIVYRRALVVRPPAVATSLMFVWFKGPLCHLSSEQYELDSSELYPGCGGCCTV